ncbi:MAG: hypothetical protein ACJ71Q_20320 [Terriglobales bacterium]|jgi:hypothetical protein
MTNTTKSTIFAAMFATLLIPGFANTLNAQDRCSTASLQGSYAFHVSGTNVSNQNLPPGPFAAVGKNTYDGRGHMSGVMVVSAGGGMITSNYTGTYTLNADCTGTKSASLDIGLTVGFSFVMDDDLREIRMIATGAAPSGTQLQQGVTVSGTARQLTTGSKDRD